MKARLFSLCFVYTLSHDVLLIHRSPSKSYMPDIWNGLGGKIEDTERPEASCAREVYEESGLSISPIFRGSLTWMNSTGDDGVLFIFSSLIAEGLVPKKDCPEGRLAFFHIDDIPKIYGIQNNVPFFIERLIKEPTSLVAALCFYDGDNFCSYKDQYVSWQGDCSQNLASQDPSL